jgi:hypothetical protein
VQTALAIVAVLYLIWGVGFVTSPEMVHKLLTTGPYSSALAAMFGAAIFALAVLFLIGVANPLRPLIQAAAAALAIIGAVALYQMFIAHAMPQNPQTVASLVIDLVTAVYLFLTQSEAMQAQEARQVVARPRKTAAKRKKR